MPAVFFGYRPGEITGTIVGDPDSLAGSKAHEEVQGVPTIDEMVVGLSGVEHDRSDDAGVLEELECSVDGGLRGAMASRLHFIEERIASKTSSISMIRSSMSARSRVYLRS